MAAKLALGHDLVQLRTPVGGCWCDGGKHVVWMGGSIYVFEHYLGMCVLNLICYIFVLEFLHVP